jgi:hypothetical protein
MFQRRHQIFRRVAFGAAGAVLFAAVSALPVAGEQHPAPRTHQQALAKWLYTLSSFAEWPSEAFPDQNAPFVLGILGEDPFGQDPGILDGSIELKEGEMPMAAVLRHLGQDLTVRVKSGGAEFTTRKLVIKHFASSRDDLTGCHLLFIGGSEEKRVSEVLKAVENTSILTIAEIDRFAERQGVLDIVWKKTTDGNEKPGLEVNVAAAKRSHLKLDPRLNSITTRTIKG